MQYQMVPISQKSKPDPEVFLKAAEYLDLQPEECIVVEDAYAGIDAAKAGNMQAVGTGEAYSYAKADYHIKKIEELLTNFTVKCFKRYSIIERNMGDRRYNKNSCKTFPIVPN